MSLLSTEGPGVKVSMSITARATAFLATLFSATAAWVLISVAERMPTT